MSGAKRRKESGRDAGGFIALPWSVMDSPGYLRLSMHARALLLEVARQYVRNNNGQLLLSRAFMEGRGWKSSDMLTKAKRELLDGGFIYETVKGQRPNRASWYAITWQTLDHHPDYDHGAFNGFRKAAYRVIAAPTAPAQKGVRKNESLRPPHGTGAPSIAPPHGTEKPSPVPPHGAMEPILAPLSVPPHGHHLDMPSPAPKAAHG